ncbi:NfeD family protein [Geitlerinema sp. P-1104]|uniref:NfeD family protein n=1 Tax=Geitlerinema sp. P-1104 TaxID=2546230 RepID=UPI002570576A|nr:NfeD family protein [Geitlerinema sp. P-1104]
MDLPTSMETFTLLWLGLGVLFCLMELFLPTAFVELSMGLAAFVVALLSLVIPQPSIQIFLWMVLALVFLFALKQFVPKKSSYVLADATEAQTLTAIEPGRVGRVLFEGNSWQARCEGDFLIPAHSKALVVGRQGNTLLVLPEDFED